MKFIKTPKKFYFHYPFIAAVIGTKTGDKVNLMSAAWHTQLSFEPPLYGVSISPKRYTYDLLKKSKVFSVNFLDFEYIETVAYVGGVSGKDVDKISAFEIPVINGRILDVPVLQEAYAVYECQLAEEVETGDHTLFIGKILGVHYNEKAFSGDKFCPNTEKISPILYIGNEYYMTVDSESKKHYPRKLAQEYIKDWKGEI